MDASLEKQHIEIERAYEERRVLAELRVLQKAIAGIELPISKAENELVASRRQHLSEVEQLLENCRERSQYLSLSSSTCA
jgi:hypothetical protein